MMLYVFLADGFEETEALEASELPKPVELELPASLAEGLPSFDPLVVGVVLSPP